MKIRAKANGNVLDLADEEAEALLATGIYEPVDGEESSTTKRKDVTAETAPQTYKTRSLRPKP